MSDKNKAYSKPKMKCPFCGIELSVNGFSQHCRFKHAEHFEEYKKNRERYIAEYTVKDDKPEPEERPEPEEPEEPANVDVEVEEVNPEPEDDESFQGEEPEYFRIRQVKPEGQIEPKKERKRFIYNPYGL